MKFSYTGIACLYLLLSFLVDPISAFWKGPSLIIFGDVFLITIVLFLFIINKHKIYTSWCLVLVSLSFAGMLMNFRYGLNIEVFKLVLKSRAVFIFMLTVFFYLYVFSKLKNDKLIKIDSFFDKIVQLNILVLLLEGVALNFFDMSDLLSSIFYESGYRIGAYYGVFGIAPNGLVFGRQNASILSIIGILRWFPFNSEWLGISLRKSTWLIAAIVTWGLTMTTTSILCFITLIVILYTGGLVKQNKWPVIFLIIIFLFIATTQYENYIISKVGHIRNKADVIENIEKTIYAFTQPLRVIKANPFETIIGGGNVPKKYSQEYLVKIKSGDLGFLAINIKYGSFLISILLITYLMYALKIVCFIKKHKSNEMNIIFRSFIVNLTIFLSLIHYTTLFANGMMQLFAATTALSYVMLKKHIADRQNLINIPFNLNQEMA